MYFQLEIGPNLTQANFWPAVNKRLTHRPEDIFLTRREKIEKIWGF